MKYNRVHRIKFDVIRTPSTVVLLKMQVFWDVTLSRWFSTLQSIMCLHVQGSSNLRRLNPEDEDATILHNVNSCSPNGMSHLRKLVPSSQYELHPSVQWTMW
jgi:hypothetical protein